MKPEKEDKSFGKKAIKKENPPKQKAEAKKATSLELKQKRRVPKLQFPKIPRIIPEPSVLMPKKSYLQWGLASILIIVALFLNLLALKDLLGVGKNWIAFIADRQHISSQMKLWESITNEYPQYRDAYVEGALYAYRLGDRQKEQYFLQNLELVDPNFPLTKTLGQLMNLQITANN